MSDSIISGLTKPLTKLIETTSAGIGKVYEPTHIRRMADAKAYELEQIGEAMKRHPELPIKYDDGKFMLDGTDFTELAKRTQQRFTFQEIKKQQNLENIIGQAAEALKDTTVVDPAPVDENWISRFFDAAAHITSAEMQQLWGRILAGEITSGGSFSLRTLDILKNFSKRDAELFNRIAPLFLYDNNVCFIPSNADLLRKYGLSYDDLLELTACGIININPFQNVSWALQENATSALFCCKDVIIIVNLGSKEEKFKFDSYFITREAKELSTLISQKSNHDYLKDVVQDFKNQLPKNSPIHIDLQLSAKK